MFASTSSSSTAVEQPKGPHLQAVSTRNAVTSTVFNNLSGGMLSAFVVPASHFILADRGMEFINQESGAKLLLRTAIIATEQPGLLDGFKIVSLTRPSLYNGASNANGNLPPARIAELPKDTTPEQVFNAKDIANRGFAVVPGIKADLPETYYLRHNALNGGVAYEPVKLLKQDQTDQPGLAPGYVLLTPPLRQPTVPRPKVGWGQ